MTVMQLCFEGPKFVSGFEPGQILHLPEAIVLRWRSVRAVEEWEQFLTVSENLQIYLQKSPITH